jgi:hypothetical protein
MKAAVTQQTTLLTGRRMASKRRCGRPEFRINFKNFAFLKNFRIKVLDPSPCLPLVDDNGEDVWGTDPVHPLPNGF